MPQSMENYYQEAGRAGRDGENSQCILLFSAQDVMIGKYLLDNKSFEEMDEEDIELIRQRDAYRLQVMEGYCKTTSCLRNYILEYFGEKIFSPCNNCGNCHRDYTETDMTAEAKWVVNCIAETRGRYGRNIVSGTLVGANRARLKEIGATAYRSYKALEQVNEKDVQILIDQMLREGYIVQSNGEYPVLQMGDITALKKEDTRVLIRKFEEKAAPVSDRRKKARSTDSLTSAGYRLFEELRSLRTAIAKEEGLPPYIIFSDKTLIDMCAKMPENRQEMLGVSGVGENKFRKYGQRFMDVVTEFIGANPNSVVSVQLEGENAEVSGDGSEDHGGKKQTNVGMRWTDEEDERLIAEFRSGMKVSEIAKAHGRTKGAVRSRLQRHGFG